MNFRETCKKWKYLDDTLLEKKKYIKRLEKKKKYLSKDITKYIIGKKLENKKFKFSDKSKLYLQTTTTNSGLSIKFLKQVLEEYSTKISKIDHESVLEFIKNKRTSKKNIVLKRIFGKLKNQ